MTRTRTTTLAACAAALALAVPTWWTSAPGSPAVQEGAVVHSACLVQFLPENDGQPTLRGGSHACIGVKAVDVTDEGQLRVHQSVTPASRYKVLSSLAHVDASLAARGIITGPSGGTGVTRFALYDTALGRELDLNDNADRARITCRICDVWFTATHIDTHAPGGR